MGRRGGHPCSTAGKKRSRRRIVMRRVHHDLAATRPNSAAGVVSPTPPPLKASGQISLMLIFPTPNNYMM